MENGENIESDAEKLQRIIQRLQDIRDKLVKLNKKNGSLLRYYAIKDEIEASGWQKICEKYHPDININDPAAFENFELYKFVYTAMQKENDL